MRIPKSMLYCAPLSRVESYANQTGARYMVSLINAGIAVPRPKSVQPRDWLFLDFNDVTRDIAGLTAPKAAHMSDYLAFLERWPRDAPLLVHCWAGISRSTAATFIAACVLRPDLPESQIAWRLRWTAPSATPNKLLVELADAELGRSGRMTAAVSEIGRGADAFEGTPFRMDLD